MTELLPCPFCGGEASLEEYPHHWAVECTECEMSAPCEKTADDAVRAWNTRHERTCKVAACYSPSDLNVEVEWYFAFSCGCELYWDEAIPPNYCPNCGAKVVD